MALDRELAIANDFAALRDRGVTAEEAAAAVGEKHGASPRKVTEIWSRRRHDYTEGENGTGQTSPLPLCDATLARVIEQADRTNEDLSRFLASYADGLHRRGRELPQALRDWLVQREGPESMQQSNP